MQHKQLVNEKKTEKKKRNILHFLCLNAEFFLYLDQMWLFSENQYLNPFASLFKHLGFEENIKLFNEFQFALDDLAKNEMDKMDTLLSQHGDWVEVIGYFLRQNTPTVLNEYLEQWYNNYSIVDLHIQTKRQNRLFLFAQIIEKEAEVSKACQILISNAEFFQACIVPGDNTSFVQWVKADNQCAAVITQFSNELKAALGCYPSSISFKLESFLRAIDQLLTNPEQMRDFLTRNEEVVNLICQINDQDNQVSAWMGNWYAENPEEYLKKVFRQNKHESSVVLTHSTHFQPNKSFPPDDKDDPGATLGSGLKFN